MQSMITIRRNVQRHNDRARSRRSMRAAAHVPVVVVARGDGAAEQVGRLAVRVHQQLRALSSQHPQLLTGGHHRDTRVKAALPL